MQREVKSFDGVKISYDIERVSKKFLILLHGAGGDLNAWKKERKNFHKKGLSTIAIDLRGHGLSDRPKGVRDYKLDKFAKDVQAVIEKEKIRNFVMAGHCFGGIVAINYYKLYPKMAKAYVLIDTTYKAPQRLKFFFKNSKLMHFMNNLLSREKTRKKFKRVNFSKFVGTKDIDLRRIYSDITHTTLKSWLYTYQNIAKFDGTKTLEEMSQPVLIIEGQDDIIFNVLVAKKMHNLVKESKLQIVPRANHIIVINNPGILERDIYKFVESLKES